MTDRLKIKDGYIIANCCAPEPYDEIRGFLKPDSGLISIHKAGCQNLRSIQIDRLLKLTWDEIIASESAENLNNDPDFRLLDEIDFRILNHHLRMGVDYAAVVGRSLGIDRATVFERHKKLRDLDLLTRVQPRMIRYRKGIVKNKWIKHRNHTYYEITERGRAFLEAHE